MCGVVALHNYRQANLVDQSELLAIRDTMAARGPDGAGAWTSPQGDVALGHRRLAIIGLGEQGAQPMLLETSCRSSGGMLAVSFNGEIYNHVDLRRQLVAMGHRFRSRCDTEVLLHMYEEYGDEFVSQLRGMYAFAIWDEQRRRLLLARDPYGIKPLYYADDGSTLRAASQVSSLIAGRGVPHTIDDRAAAAFFLFGNVPEPLTMYERIRTLPAGSRLVVEQGRVSGPTIFFSLAEALQRASLSNIDGRDCDEEVRRGVLESVAAHMVSDVEVGVFLSAGIDSATVLAAAAEVSGQLSAVTLGFEEFVGTSSDEVPFAAEVARLYGAKHTVEIVTRADFELAFGSIFSDMDQPSVDGVNIWLVSRAARNIGLKVALSGLGGDELFAGYRTFEAVPRWAARLRLPARIPGLGRAATAGLRRVLPARVSPKAAGLLEYGRTIGDVWFLRRGLFMPWDLPALLGEDRAIAAIAALDLRSRINESLSPDPITDFGRVAALEGSLYMRNQLLRDTDWASMAHSVEVRVPLVDPALLEQVAPLMTRRSTASRGKLILGRVARPLLPPHIVSRGKTGFSVPVGDWLERGDQASWRRVPMLNRPGCPWARRWAYTVADRFGMLQA